ncbi:MAG: 4Fe-4S ferredoxin [Peptococcaceae bacterium BICA1-8]|nr:MAG: 4Fe-4S ferredoxin [Peptococcaceae bacterium BICA1-8]
MNINRRKFLKVGGVLALGLSIAPVSGVLAGVKGKYMPNSKALTGKNWAMVIDMKKLDQDIDACITACHKEHNVPDIGNKKEEVKWAWTDKYGHLFHDNKHEYMNEEMEHKDFLALCNHCENPACVRVCPTQATFKSKDGIVMMDYHRCIGCRYCMAGCPYGARSFNFKDPRPFIEETNPAYPTRTKGVVEKCNFCVERLAKGLIPACAEASKNGGILFGDLEDPNSEVRKILDTQFTVQRRPSLGTKPKVFYIL